MSISQSMLVKCSVKLQLQNLNPPQEGHNHHDTHTLMKTGQIDKSVCYIHCKRKKFKFSNSVINQFIITAFNTFSALS